MTAGSTRLADVMCNEFLRAVLLFFVFLSLTASGCGTSEPMVNSAITLTSALPDSTAKPSQDQYAWTDYHYGYWEYDRGIGWVWVPGYAWSPAHVVWYTGFEYSSNSPLPPPDLVLPLPGEANSVMQGGNTKPTRGFSGEFAQMNLKAILEKIQTHRAIATTREVLRADLALDFPLALFGEDTIPPPGPPPVPHFIFVSP
jgi:hypothetical protein